MMFVIPARSTALRSASSSTYNSDAAISPAPVRSRTIELDDEVDVAREAWRRVVTRGERPGDHVRDTEAIELCRHEFENVELVGHGPGQSTPGE